jgi:hypothetical protein
MAGASASAQVPCINGDPNCVSFQGPVGIGTAAPTQKLEVYDGFLQVTRPAGSTASAGMWFRQNAVPNNNGVWGLVARNSGDLVFYHQGLNVDAFKLLPNGRAAFLGGNVGIGTHEPLQMLELRKDEADIGILYHDPDSVWYSTGVNKLAGRQFFINRGGYPGFQEDIVLDPSTGNVGIGTKVAPSKLTVAGAIQVGSTPVISPAGQWVGSPTGLVGPQGPQGVQGPQGAQGAQGIQGPQGPAVHTSAFCGVGDCQPQCSGGVVSCIQTGSAVGCTVTADTGTCSRPAGQGQRCYVCKP